MMRFMAEKGFATYTPDQRGHGQSAELLGYIKDLDAIVSDILLFRSMAEKEHQGKPVFLLGHSMGGMLSLIHAQRYPSDLAGLVCCGSGILVPPNIPAFMVKLSMFLGRVLPKLAVQPFFDPKKLSRLQAVRDSVCADPLFYRGKIRARTGSELLYGMKTSVAGLKDLVLPLLVLHGGSDQVVPPRASEVVMEKASSEDKTHKVFDEALHEVFNEPEGEEAMELVATWISDRIASPA
jgi:alpha-beta hydrolase superfamily lysophospholipase